MYFFYYYSHESNLFFLTAIRAIRKHLCMVILQKNQKVNRLENHQRFDYLIMRKNIAASVPLQNQVKEKFTLPILRCQLPVL